jgi:hypothetical protein
MGSPANGFVAEGEHNKSKLGGKVHAYEYGRQRGNMSNIAKHLCYGPARDFKKMVCDTEIMVFVR